MLAQSSHTFLAIFMVYISRLLRFSPFSKVDDEYSEKFIVGDTDNGGVFGSNNFWDQANDLMEKMMYSGTCAIVIRLKNAVVSSDGRLLPSPDAWIDLNYLVLIVVYANCDMYSPVYMGS